MTPNRAASVLMISYHFWPSMEIGARRATALAKYLGSQGCAVWVVSEFGGSTAASCGSQLAPGVWAIPVPQPRRWLLDSIVLVKQALSFRKARSASTSQLDLSLHAREPAISGGLGRRLKLQLRVWFFRKLFFIDDKKRWSWQAARAAVAARDQHRAQVVITSGPPFSAVLAGARIARRLHIPHIADMRDPWTDHRPRSPYTPRGAELFLARSLERRVMHSAAAITSTGAAVVEILANRYPAIRPRLHVIRNGYDGNVSAPPAATGGRLSILFAGELYAKRNPFPILEAIERLLGRESIDVDRISVTFIGRCAYYRDEPLADWLRGKRCERVVKILAQLPPERIAEVTRESTVLLNLAQEQPLSVPAKTFEHLASGRELLLITEDDSETAGLVKDIAGVTQLDPAKPAAFDAALADLYQRHVIQGTLHAPSAADVARYSRMVANQQFLAIVRAVIGPCQVGQRGANVIV